MVMAKRDYKVYVHLGLPSQVERKAVRYLTISRGSSGTPTNGEISNCHGHRCRSKLHRERGPSPVCVIMYPFPNGSFHRERESKPLENGRNN